MAAGLGLAGLLAGCSSVPKAINPVQWWHGLQGGAIAEQRPPPPGADDPYPNLASVPERPPASDPRLREQIAQALIADRGAAQHAAAGAQVSDPSSPTASPSLFGHGSVPPPGPAPAPAPTQAGGASATMAAASQAAPAPAAPPPMATERPRPTGIARAPVGEVQSTPLDAPAPTTASAAPRPALPTTPPPPANLPGAAASAPVPLTSQLPAIPTTTVAAPGTPPPAAAPTAASAAPRPDVPPVGVPFAIGSASVPRGSLPALRRLAQHRGNADIAVTGYGEATASDAAAQTSAVSLALARAQAVAAALVTAGVPATAIRVDAEAAGRGAAARLVD